MNVGGYLPNISVSLDLENVTRESGGDKKIRQLFCTADGGHQLFLSVVNFFLSVIATLGNILILVALRKASRLHPPSKLLLRCLTATDLCVGVVSEPLYATYLISYEMKSVSHWSRLCEYTGSLTTVSFTMLSAVSLLTLTAISVDRLLALSLKMKYRRVVTLTRVRMIVVFFWISSIAFSSTAFKSLAISKGFGYSVKFLCVLVSGLCYARIYFILRRHCNQSTDFHGVKTASSGKESKADLADFRKTLSSAIWVQLSLIVCYLPYSIVIAVITLTKLTPSLYMAWGYTATFVYFNSSLNPFVYCWKIREVRKAVKDTVMGKRESEQVPRNTSALKMEISSVQTHDFPSS